MPLSNPASSFWMLVVELAPKITKLVGSDIDRALLDACPEFLSRTLVL